MQLRKLRWLACEVMLLAATASLAQNFKQYPGSKVDESASSEASNTARGIQSQVYTTNGDFSNIYAFYKGLYKEVPTPFPTQKLRNGQEVKWAFFVLDGASDLSHSKFWLKIQHPYIGTVGEDDLDFKQIRDVSVIQTVRTQPK